MTLSRFNEGTGRPVCACVCARARADNVLFVITSCLVAFCESSNYTQTFNITFTWTTAPPTTSSSSPLVLAIVYGGIIGLPVLCCCCCLYCFYKRQCCRRRPRNHACRLKQCCFGLPDKYPENVKLMPQNDSSNANS